jgi:hypothetical protein
VREDLRVAYEEVRMTLVMQGPPPQQPGSPDDDPRPEQPHPLDDPSGSPTPPDESEEEAPDL